MTNQVRVYHILQTDQSLVRDQQQDILMISLMKVEHGKNQAEHSYWSNG